MSAAQPVPNGPPEPIRPTTYREIERKVRVPEAFVLPRLEGGLVARAQAQPTVALTAAYHDTADLRLIRWGATLRRREGGPDAGWHLKLPVEGAGHGVRDELGLPLDAGEVGSVPAAMADIVRPLVREAPLVHVATVRTRRTPYVLIGGEGEQVAELVDDHVEVVEGGDVVRRFHEIEVESTVLEGERSSPVLDAVVVLLERHGGTPGTEGKAAAALGGRANAAPDVVVPPWPGKHDPAREAVLVLIARFVHRFLLEDVRVRRDLPDSVHQMRVAARRLRSALRAFRPLLDEGWARDLRDELSWAAGTLGELRDTEVLLARLDEHAQALGEHDAALVLPAIDGRLRQELGDLRRVALEELRSARHVVLLTDLVEAARAPRFTTAADKPAEDVFPPLVQRAWKKLARAVKALELDSPPEEWHQARILAKRARYAAESVAPVLGAGTKHLGEALARVTDLLGDQHDAAVAAERLRDLAERPEVDGPTGYALGLLHGIEVERERADREQFRDIWPEIKAVHAEFANA
jgi:CHAD domain-containing protein